MADTKLANEVFESTRAADENICDQNHGYLRKTQLFDEE